MKTVKEISNITGISVRMLQYYQRIGLLKSNKTDEAGHLLYEDKALDMLQQILFFKEFDTVLNDINSIINNPNYDKYTALENQKELLILKRDRLDDFIKIIDHILNEANHMSFDELKNEDVDEIFQYMLTNIEWKQLEPLSKECGSMNEWKKKNIKGSDSPSGKENLSKMITWYNHKDKVKNAVKKPITSKERKEYQEKMYHLLEKTSLHKSNSADSPIVQRLIKKYESVLMQLYRSEDVTKILLEHGNRFCSNETIIKANDAQFGEGASAFLGSAILYYIKDPMYIVLKNGWKLTSK